MKPMLRGFDLWLATVEEELNQQLGTNIEECGFEGHNYYNNGWSPRKAVWAFLTEDREGITDYDEENGILFTPTTM